MDGWNDSAMSLKSRITGYIKDNSFIHGAIYWSLGTKSYNRIVKQMKDMTYVIIVDAHVGHYMMALAAVGSYKKFHNLNQIGIIIPKKYSDMAMMWKDDIDEIITVDDAKDLFRLSHYLYIRKEMSIESDKRLIPYYFGNGEYGIIKWYVHKHYEFLNENRNIDIKKFSDYDLSFSDVNVNSILRLNMGEPLSVPNIEPSENDIKLFEKLGLPKGKGILLVPSAQCAKSLDVSLIKTISEKASEMGYSVYLNAGPNEKAYDESVKTLSLSVTQTLKAAKYMGHVIASQSGMIDVLVLARFESIRVITYQGTEFDKRPGYFYEHQNMMLKETGLPSDIYVNVDVNEDASEDDIVSKVFEGWE